MTYGLSATTTEFRGITGSKIMSHFRATLLLLILCSTASAQAPKKQFPSFDRVVEATVATFEDEFRSQPGEIISQSQVERVFERMREIGWVVPDQEGLLKQVLRDNDLLVQDLRTPAGRKFCLEVAKYPGAYDRLDRLIRMPTGRSAVARLIAGPDGIRLLQYMTTTPGGANMGRMLSNTPTGRDFNKPTGRIYMLSELIPELKVRYQASVAARAKS